VSKRKWNSPPNWPAPPTWWSPPAGWKPDPAWGPAPEGWDFGAGVPKRRVGKTVALIAGGLFGALLLIGVVGATIGGPSAPTPATLSPTIEVPTADPSSQPSTDAPSAAPQPQPASARPPATKPPVLAVAPDPLTGIGATDAAWERTHRPDDRYDAGAAYNPGFVPTADRANDQYYAVDHLGGRIGMFSERMPPNAGVEEAMAQVQGADLPPDAKTVWSSVMGTCRQVQYQSATMATFSGEPHGGAVVSFYSAVDGPYRSDHITEAFVTLLYSPTSADASC